MHNSLAVKSAADEMSVVAVELQDLSQHFTFQHSRDLHQALGHHAVLS